MKLQIIFLLLLGALLAGKAQSPLDTYISQALQQNIRVQQQKLTLEAAKADLKLARQQLLPTLSVNARYSVAYGGRAFIIPVGDLVNPIYSNLNALNEVASRLRPTTRLFRNIQLSAMWKRISCALPNRKPWYACKCRSTTKPF